MSIYKIFKKIIRVIKRDGLKKSFNKMILRIRNIKNNKNINCNYEDWIKNNEPNDKQLEEQKNNLFSMMPLISIVIPLYNPNISYFKELLDSILDQTYSNFELCLADGSTYPNEIILEMIKNDNRIKYKFLKQNMGISANTNAALKLATGDFIALVDHDDILPKFALFEIVKTINKHPNVDFIYSDEDIIKEDNIRCNPHFKPDFSPDTLRSYNYICHLTVIKRSLLNVIGDFRKEFDGAQDYDFILRATEKAKLIVHIPKILYHWRSHQNSTAGNNDSKDYVHEAGRQAILDQLRRLDIKGKVLYNDVNNRFKVEYNIINQPKISILIPNKDNISDLKKCINSIRKSTYQNYEIIVIENNSILDKTFKYYQDLEQDVKVKIIKYDENGFNYSKINNIGAQYANGDYLLLLNNDIEVITPNWLQEMLGICQRPEVGIVGAKLLYSDNTVQHAGVVLGIGGVAGHIHKNISDNDDGYFSRANIINNFTAVTAACMMVKTDVYKNVNGLDENFKVAFNDIDFCMKVRKMGLLVVYTPYAKLYHFESKSRGLEDTKEKKARFASEIELFRDKWYNEINSKDPYFNINLRLDSEKFLIDTSKYEEEKINNGKY